MKYVGLQSQIWKNNVNSFILLLLFPSLLLTLLWGFFYITNYLENEGDIITGSLSNKITDYKILKELGWLKKLSNKFIFILSYWVKIEPWNKDGKYFYKEKAKLESTYDFIDCASAYHYGTNLYYEEIFKRKLDKLQPLFMDVINDIYEKYKELMEISSLLEPSLETFSCYITIDEEEYDDIEDKSIIYFTPQKYVDTLSSYTHEKEDVVKCILYCFARQDEIPTELALLILSFIGFKRISLFEKYFELLDVEEGDISTLIV